MSTTTDKAIPTWGEAKTLGVGDWQLIAKSNRFENNTSHHPNIVIQIKF